MHAIEPGAKIIIMGTVLPLPGSILSTVERLLRVRDLTVKQFSKSQERTIGDWTAIFRTKADRCLKMPKVNQSFDGYMYFTIVASKKRQSVLCDMINRLSARMKRHMVTKARPSTFATQ